jgi:nucleoside-specific outer membrane channel protein Tsx
MTRTLNEPGLLPRLAVSFGLVMGSLLLADMARGQEQRLPPVDEHEYSGADSAEVDGAESAHHGLCWASKPMTEFVRFSNTEVQFQYGYLAAPSFVGGQSTATRILTFQHASNWRYGENFLFIDVLDDSLADRFNDDDVYLEWYPALSLGRILDRRIGCGLISDVALIGGINYGADANFVKWLPGIRWAWSLPGFAFLNTDFTAYLDASGGLQSGGAPAESDSFMIDVSWAYPITLGTQAFSVEGHAEFIGRRQNELGNDVSWWVLAQPQFRYDLGKALWGTPQKLFVGVEWQVWPNKLGDRATEENAVQALAVWRL